MSFGGDSVAVQDPWWRKSACGIDHTRVCKAVRSARSAVPSLGPSSCSAQASAAWGRAALQMHWDGPGPMPCSGSRSLRTGKHHRQQQQQQRQQPQKMRMVIRVSVCCLRNSDRQPEIAAKPVSSTSFTDEQSWLGSPLAQRPQRWWGSSVQVLRWGTSIKARPHHVKRCSKDLKWAVRHPDRVPVIINVLGDQQANYTRPCTMYRDVVQSVVSFSAARPPCANALLILLV